jgi:hypothetical protein
MAGNTPGSSVPIQPPDTTAVHCSSKAIVPMDEDGGAVLEASSSARSMFKRAMMKIKVVNTFKLTRAMKMKLAGLSFMRHKNVMTVMSVLIMWSLFGDDIRLAVAPKSADSGFFSIAAFMLAVFSAEFTLLCFAKPGYKWKFYFWLDLVATISLIPDIGWIWYEIENSMSPESQDQQAALKTSRLSRIGGRASRIVRVIRIVRLIRVAKLVQVWAGSTTADQQQEGKQMKPSRVGANLVESMTKRVVVLVLTMLIGVPLIDLVKIGGDQCQLQDAGLKHLHRYNQAPSSSTLIHDMFRDDVQTFADNAGDILSLQLCEPGSDGSSSGCLHQASQQAQVDGWLVEAGEKLLSYVTISSEYRTSETMQFVAGGCLHDHSNSTTSTTSTTSTCRSSLIVDVRSVSRADAVVNILTTLFVLAVLCGSVISLTKCAEALGAAKRIFSLSRAHGVTNTSSTHGFLCRQ